MNKSFIIMLSGLLLIQSTATYSNDPRISPTLTEKFKKFHNGFVQLGSAACSAAAGLFIGQKTFNDASAQFAQNAIHFEKANELLRPWLDAVAQTQYSGLSMKNSLGEYSQGFIKSAIASMPSNHPYAQEIHKISDCNYAIPAGFVCSIALLTIAGAIAYNYFCSTEPESNPSVSIAAAINRDSLESENSVQTS